MKILTLVPFLLLSCGKTDKKTIYIENPFDNSKNEERLNILENSIQDNINNINDLSLEADSIVGSVASLETMIISLQSETNNTISRLVTLETQDSVIGYLNPCGDNPNQYDEYLFKTKSGSVFAYFEHGSQRYLTKLDINILYQTTDKQACKFKIDSNGTLLY